MLAGCQVPERNEHQEQHGETPKRMHIQHQPLLLHYVGLRKSWSDWAVGGQIYLWVLELKLQSWPWRLAVTPEIGHRRASWSVSIVYCSHFSDCSAEAHLFLSIAPNFYALLKTSRKKNHIISSVVVKCPDYLLQMTQLFQKTFRIAWKALISLHLKAKCTGYNSFTLCKIM